MKAVCDFIIKFKPDVVVTEKGVSGIVYFCNFKRFILSFLPES
jgi:hypothetical protein